MTIPMAFLSIIFLYRYNTNYLHTYRILVRRTRVDRLLYTQLT